MIKIELTDVNFGVFPAENGGKQISFFHQPTQTIYAAPFSDEGLKLLIEQLTMDNEALERLIEQKRLEQQLAVSPEEQAAVQNNGIIIPGGNQE